MRNINISLLLCTVLYGSLEADATLAKEHKQGHDISEQRAQSLVSLIEGMSQRMDELFDAFGDIHKKTSGQSVAPGASLEITHDEQYVILSLSFKGSENLDATKDISIDVEDNLLVVQVPVHYGKIVLEAYENRLTVCETHEMKKEKKEQEKQFFSSSSQVSMQTQLLPARIDVSNTSAIIAEYAADRLIIKLPKRLAKKISIKTQGATVVEK
jgi:hypothetical protein